MPCLLVAQGLPGSGKTTWAKELALESGAVRVNRDDIRDELGGYHVKREKQVRQIRDARILSALRCGVDVINDDTNITPKHIADMRLLAEACDAQLVVQDSFMEVTVEECIKRDLQRERSVGKDVIEKFYYQYWSHQPKPENEGIYKAVICDLDGTLALLPEGMGYPAAFDRDYRGDRLNQPVFELLKAMAGAYHVILMSGRFSERLEETKDWLYAHNIPFNFLFCRAEGDRRPDTVVKKELYLSHVQGRYQIEFVIDDRPSIVRMWRAECGLTCLQVAANMEF